MDASRTSSNRHCYPTLPTATAIATRRRPPNRHHCRRTSPESRPAQPLPSPDLHRLRDHFLANTGGPSGGVQACIGAIPEFKAILEKELAASTVGKMKKAQKKQRIEGDISRFTYVMSSSSVQSKPVSVSKQSGTLNNFWKPVEKQQVDDIVADFFYTSAISFNVARNPHFRNAVQKIAEFGKGYTPLGSKAIRTTLLQRSKDRVTEKLADVKATWKETVLSKGPKGKNIEQIILNSNFWESAAKVFLVCEPIVDVLRMVDGDTPCLGMLYGSMDRCKESIQKAINNEETEYMQIWETVDCRWKMMHTLLHVAACFLEPRLFAIDRRGDNEIMAGLYQAISKYAPDPKIAALIRDQSWQYKRGEGMFGGAEAKYDSPHINLKLLMNKSAKTTSLEQTLEGIAMPDADEPDFADDELSSDTDNDDLAS
ncbi:hypothetical protein SUGI_0655250 [Cryptomeria japonica]|nr:hypothetical protein SUGI_0655250 [Cryptomeria japonica]